MPAKYDQHFLIDGGIADEIVEAASLKAGDRVIEIGPGEGVLTGRILAAGAELTAVEIDPRLAARLETSFSGNPRFRLLREDFLTIDLGLLPRPAVIISNLPYSVGTPIVQRLLDWPGWEHAVLMLQKEVVERIVAEPGSRAYGPLSLSVQIKAEAGIILEAGPESFLPPPRVSSAVMTVRRRPKSLLPPALGEMAFFRLVHAAFQQRRKMAAKSISGVLGLERAVVERAFAACGIDPRTRAERIPLESFTALAGELGFNS